MPQIDGNPGARGGRGEGEALQLPFQLLQELLGLVLPLGLRLPLVPAGGQGLLDPSVAPDPGDQGIDVPDLPQIDLPVGQGEEMATGGGQALRPGGDLAVDQAEGEGPEGLRGVQQGDDGRVQGLAGEAAVDLAGDEGLDPEGVLLVRIDMDQGIAGNLVVLQVVLQGSFVTAPTGQGDLELHVHPPQLFGVEVVVGSLNPFLGQLGNEAGGQVVGGIVGPGGGQEFPEQVRFRVQGGGGGVVEQHLGALHQPIEPLPDVIIRTLLPVLRLLAPLVRVVVPEHVPEGLLAQGPLQDVQGILDVLVGVVAVDPAEPFPGEGVEESSLVSLVLVARHLGTAEQEAVAGGILRIYGKLPGDLAQQLVEGRVCHVLEELVFGESSGIGKVAPQLQGGEALAPRDIPRVAAVHELLVPL